MTRDRSDLRKSISQLLKVLETRFWAKNDWNILWKFKYVGTATVIIALIHVFVNC